MPKPNQPDPKNAFGMWDYRMLPKLNVVLKAFGLRLKQRSNHREWGDQVEVAVERIQPDLTVREGDTCEAVWNMLNAAMDVVAIHGASKPEFAALNNARYELEKVRRNIREAVQGQ